ARAAAAVSPHIVVAEQLGDHNSEHNAAQKITFQRSKHTGRDQLQYHDDSSLRMSASGSVAMLPHEHTDGRTGQAERLPDLILDIALIREMEQRFLVHEGDERRRTGGTLGD